MTQRLKISLLVFGGLAGVLFLGLLGGLTFLRSAAGSRWLLNKVKSTLAAKGMELDFAAGSSVDILRGLHLRDVHLRQQKDGIDLDVRVPAIDVDYEISLWRRHLTVHLARLDHPTVHYYADNPPAPATPVEKTSPSNPTESARKAFRSPPVTLTLEKFELVTLSVDFSSKRDGTEMAARLPDTTLKAALDLGASFFRASGDFRSSAANEFRLVSKAMRASLDPKLNADWAIAITPEGDHAKLAFSPSHFGFSVDKIAFEKPDLSLTLSGLRGQATMQADGRLGQPLAEGPSELTAGSAHFDAHFAGRGRQGAGRKTQPLGFDSQELVVEAKVGEDILLTADYQLRRLVAAALTRAVDANGKASARIAKDLRRFTNEGLFSLNGLELARVRGEGAVENGLHAKEELTASTDARLAALLKSGAGLRQLGALRTIATLDVKAPGNYTGFLEAARLADDRTALQGEAKVEATQTAPSPTLRFAPVTAGSRFARNDGKWTFDASVENASLRTQSLSIPAEKLALKGDWGSGQDHAGLEGIWRIGDEEALRFRGDTSLGASQLQFKGTVEALVGRYLDTILGKKITAAYGRWRTKSELTLEAHLPEEGSLAKEGSLKASGTTEVSQLAEGGAPSKLSLPQPIVIHHDASLEKAKGRVELTGHLPSIKMAGVGKYDDATLELLAVTPDAETFRDLDVTLRTKRGRVYLPNAPELSGLAVDIAAKVRNKARFDFTRCQLDFNHGMLQAHAEGGGDVIQQNFLLKGEMQLRVPASFPAVAGHRASGGAQFPWNLYVRHGRELDFDGTLALDKIGWSHGGQSFSGMSGRVPVSEKLIRNGVSLEFASLITQNPFERVDFDRLRPLIHRADQLRIEKIAVEDKTYGPMLGYFSLSQNMLFARQFDLTVGSRGAAYGEMYLNFHPQSLQLGLLARLTAMDLTEILPRKYLVKVPSGDKRLSGRAGMVVNLHRGSVDGRIDITEIGAGQLLLMINVLDPGFKDEKMNLARTALGVGYPSFVGMVFENGYLDLGVDLHVPGGTQRIDVRAIPISTMVTSASAEVAKKTKGVPLK